MGVGCKLGGFKVYRIRPIRGRDLHTRTIAWGEKGWALFPEGVLGNHWGSRRACAMVQTDPGQSVGGEKSWDLFPGVVRIAGNYGIIGGLCATGTT